MRDTKNLAWLTIVLTGTLLTACEDEHPPGKDNGGEGLGVEDGDADKLGDIDREDADTPDPADLPDPAEDPSDTPDDAPDGTPDGQLAEGSSAALGIVLVGIVPVILLSLAIARSRPGSDHG